MNRSTDAYVRNKLERIRWRLLINSRRQVIFSAAICIHSCVESCVTIFIYSGVDSSVTVCICSVVEFLLQHAPVPMSCTSSQYVMYTLVGYRVLSNNLYPFECGVLCYNLLIYGVLHNNLYPLTCVGF